MGGLIGSGIGWLETAYVMIKAGEYLNRDEFGARLHKVSDEGRRDFEARFKQRLSRRDPKISNRRIYEVRKANLQPGEQMPLRGKKHHEGDPVVLRPICVSIRTTISLRTWVVITT